MISIEISLPPEIGKRKKHTKVEKAAAESHNVKLKVHIFPSINHIPGLCIKSVAPQREKV